MSYHDAHARRREQARKQRARLWLERFVALGSLIVVAAVVATVVLDFTAGSSKSKHPAAHSSTHSSRSASSSGATRQSATTTVPILMYHVINVAPPATSADPGLYVPADEFTSQMEALKSQGWHAVTLDQLEAHWTKGASLGPGKPFVISFDNGYASQYTNALPVLKRLGWVGVVNLQLNGLAPSDGGLSEAQVHGLVAAGWELDSKGIGATDLTSLDSTQLQQELTGARQTLHSRYGVPAHWFSYPLGLYDATVTAAVRAAGFVGATTAVAGWASPQQDRFRLPRLRVMGGTSAPQLLAQIASAKSDPAPPPAYSGPAIA